MNDNILERSLLFNCVKGALMVFELVIRVTVAKLARTYNQSIHSCTEMSILI